MRSQPAAYSNTDSAEQDAVNTLLSLIDTKYVKTDIRTRDKMPNIDGSIELTNDAGVPQGKFDVQVRKVPKDTLGYSCPMSLVEYSKVSTLPLVLICVDVENKSAYWKAISHTMPELKDGQASFVIRFERATDCIGSGTPYLMGWRRVISDYQERISGFPTLKQEISEKLTVDGLSREDKIFFQKYIDTINQLLDGDFVSIKTVMLPDVWKLGVGVYAATPKEITFQLYKVRNGETAPLVCQVRGKPFVFEQHDSKTVIQCRGTRSHFADPVASGKSYVLDRVKEAFDIRAFTVHGKLLSLDVLFSFIDNYGHCLGLQPDRESYVLAEIRNGVSCHLPRVVLQVASALPIPKTGTTIELGIDTVAMIARNPDFKLDQNVSTIALVLLRGGRIPIRAVEDSIRYLQALGVQEIHRPFRRPTVVVASRPFVWSGYSPDDEWTNVEKILSSSIAEYGAFVSGNHLRFPNSPYLDQTTAIAYVYESGGAQWTAAPTCQCYYIKNGHPRLPKLSAYRNSDAAIEITGGSNLRIGNESYKYERFSTGIASFLFKPTPVLSLVYQMLRDDLADEHELNIFSNLM